jgi:hypothetical protein
MPLRGGFRNLTAARSFAYALLAASWAAEVTTEHVYLVLITPPGKLDEDREAPSP